MTSPLQDLVARERAVDPRESFCVSAPAGSGKTELLIQRFLALLTAVAQPEQVVAITFTRKAAAEMRERILLALEQAADATPLQSAHEQRTRALALAALAHDAALGWNLLAQPGRLRVRTIDSFCADLARQMPVLSALGGGSDVVDDARELYREAVDDLFACLDTDRPEVPDLAALLLHFDNRWDRVSSLMVGVLGRRDQWRGYLDNSATADAYLRRLTTSLVEDTLAKLQSRLAGEAMLIDSLLAYRGENLPEALAGQLPDTGHDSLPLWRDIRQLLLTQKGEFRKSFNKRIGFPAGKGRPDAMRHALAELVGRLETDDALAEDLLALDTLPDEDVNPAAWQLLVHLTRVLPLLAACLLLVFQRHGKVDHVQTALAALEALGDDDTPTDIAMRLDYAVEHLLVDEFQDTAINQYELIRRLSRGWLEHNMSHPEQQRTLMVVGDAMQSIYGFRDTNVSLFLRARDEGFNGLRLTSLQLSSNFRSDAGIVNWVNQSFRTAFPARDDASRGDVSFTPGVPARPMAANTPVQVLAFAGDSAADAQQQAICRHIQRLLTDDPGQSIAVFGRTRRQLQPLLAAMRAAAIPYSARDIDSLSGEPVILDLLLLCRALANRYDRLAWLALMRAPWCGLPLADLLLVSRACRGRLPAQVLQDQAWPGTLSDDGKARLTMLAGALAHGLATRDRRSLRDWLEAVWLLLEGPHCYADSDALENALRFFTLLEEADHLGLGLDCEWLQARVNSLYSTTGAGNAPVQVMTLHKSKGLEFAHVILPDLARSSRPEERQLFRWDDHTTAAGEQGFLLAADDHSPPGTPSLYNHLGREQRRKTRLETTRLLYVGCTRAARSLLLCAQVKLDEKTGQLSAPPEGSLVAALWDSFEHSAAVHHAAERMEPVSQRPVYDLQRLKLLDHVAAVDRAPAQWLDDRGAVTQPGGWDYGDERAIGIAVHTLLERLAQRSPLANAPGDEERRLAELLLCNAGLGGQALAQARTRVLAQVARALAPGAIGRWILDPGHGNSACELPLRARAADGDVRTYVIDRYFVDRSSGERWLVDYKTSEPDEGETTGDFCARQAQVYAPQLAAYREALLGLEDGPLHCALYFTALDRLHEVTPVAAPSAQADTPRLGEPP